MGIRRTDPACFCSEAIFRIIPIPKDWTIHAVLNKADYFIDVIKMREARRQRLSPATFVSTLPTYWNTASRFNHIGFL